MLFIDARLPLRFGALATRAGDEAVLLDGTDSAAEPVARFTPGPGGHALDCACCMPRSGAAAALAALFRRRAVGQAPPFRRVLAVVSPAGEAAVRAALIGDAVASGRYRLE